MGQFSKETTKKLRNLLKKCIIKHWRIEVDLKIIKLIIEKVNERPQYYRRTLIIYIFLIIPAILIGYFLNGMNLKKETFFEDLKTDIKTGKIPIFTVNNNEKNQKEEEKHEKISALVLLSGSNEGSINEYPLSELTHISKDIADGLVNTYEISWVPTGANIGEEVKVKITVSYEGVAKEPFTAELSRTYIAKNCDQKI
jgi:hypothetical protein